MRAWRNPRILLRLDGAAAHPSLYLASPGDRLQARQIVSAPHLRGRSDLSSAPLPRRGKLSSNSLVLPALLARPAANETIASTIASPARTRSSRRGARRLCVRRASAGFPGSFLENLLA